MAILSFHNETRELHRPRDSKKPLSQARDCSDFGVLRDNNQILAFSAAVLPDPNDNAFMTNASEVIWFLILVPAFRQRRQKNLFFFSSLR
jgi:hypothetical protein